MLIYVPVVSSAVAMAIIWQYIFDNEYGIINQILGVNIPWMTNGGWLKVAIIIKTVWGNLGRTMILCIAGLMAVSKGYYEAAEIDGAFRPRCSIFSAPELSEIYSRTSIRKFSRINTPADRR